MQAPQISLFLTITDQNVHGWLQCILRGLQIMTSLSAMRKVGA